MDRVAKEMLFLSLNSNSNSNSRIFNYTNRGTVEEALRCYYKHAETKYFRFVRERRITTTRCVHNYVIYRNIQSYKHRMFRMFTVRYKS